MSNEEIIQEVRQVVEIIEDLYQLKQTNIKKKLENIQRINVDSLVQLIEEKNIDIFKTKKELIAYIESIIQD